MRSASEFAAPGLAWRGACSRDRSSDARVLTSGCTGTEPTTSASGPADALPAPGARPVACTSEIINGYFQSPRFTGPANTFDPAATLKSTAQLLSSDCAVDPEACVRQVIAAVNANPPPRGRDEGLRTYTSSAACSGAAASS